MVDLRACPVIPFIWAKPFYPGSFIHRFKGKTLTSERMQHKKKKKKGVASVGGQRNGKNGEFSVKCVVEGGR